MQGFGGVGLKNDLESWSELVEGPGCELRYAIACTALGGGLSKH